MRRFLSRLGLNFVTVGLNSVATGSATMCCYFMFHQPKVPQNLKKFSKNK